MKPLELRDIHLPDAVSWWPPAIGWWLLLLVVIILIIGIIFIVKKMQQVSVRKTAMAEFTKIKSDYQQHQNKTLLSQQLSQLLRQILLSTHPREDVASVSGEQWLSLLQASHPKGVFELSWLENLTLAAYQKQAEYDADLLLSGIQRWIETFPKRYLL